MKKLLLLIFLTIPTLNFSQTLVNLAERNDFGQLIQAVHNGANVNQTDANGFTALHIAAWNGYADITQFLLDSGANPNATSHSGSSPLRFATPETREILLQYGAVNIDPVIKAPRMIYSPRYYVESTNPTRVLVSNVVTNTQTTIVTNISNFVSNFIENTTIISNAQRVYDYPKLSYNLLTNVTPQQSIATHNWDVDGNNSIHQAAREGDLDKIKELIEFGINPKALNVIGDTALRFATEHNHFDVVQYLVEEVGLDVNAANRVGTTALIVATFNDNAEMIQYLAYMGANVNQTASADVTRTVGGEEQEFTINGFTAIMAAAQLGYVDSIKMLLDSGANLNATDSDNWNALLFAVQNGHLETAEFLLYRGINYNIETSDNLTAMSLATLNNDPEMIKILEKVNAIQSSVPLVSFDESYEDGGYYYEESSYEDDYYDDEYSYEYGDDYSGYDDYSYYEE